MVRLVSDEEEVWQLLQKWVAGRATLERGATVRAMHLNTVPGFETTVAAFATDPPGAHAVGHALPLRSRLDPRGAHCRRARYRRRSCARPWMDT